MSAEDLGLRELGQVRSQRLDELLTTLRLLRDPSSNSRIGIPALDKLLANHATRFDPTNLSAIPTPPIIEITSPVPKSGKTELLHWVIANLVLGTDDADPSEGDEADRADKHAEDGMRTTPDHAARDNEDLAAGAQSTLNESEAAHIDATAHRTPDQSRNNSAPHTDPPQRSKPITPKAVALLSTSPVNISRLSQLLLQHLQTTTPNLSLTEAQPIIATALLHIHIYQPTSLPSLLATLSSLPSYFLSPSNISKDRRLGAIAISTPSSYFWEDNLKSTSTSATSTKGKFPALAAVLKRVSTQLSTPIIYTTSQFSPTSDPLALQPALPSPFATVPTLRLVISRNTVKGFNKEIDAETAVKQTKARDIAVASAGFRIQVNRWGNEGWNERNEREGHRGFEVRIDERGVRLI